MIQHIVVHLPGDKSLIDRQSLAMLLERSEETIRKTCEVVEYRQGKALYNMDDAAEALHKARRRGPNKQKAA